MSSPNARLYAGTALILAALISLAWVRGADWAMTAVAFMFGLALVLASLAEDAR